MLSTLIVEDDAAHRLSLHQLLRRRFPALDIAEAEDGETALRRALSRRFDAFMDIRLPRKNGLDLTRIIKSVFDESLICVLTSYDKFEYREAAFRNGVDHFMVKGESTEAEIVSRVESLARACGTDYCVLMTPFGHTELVSIVNSIQARRKQH